MTLVLIVLYSPSPDSIEKSANLKFCVTYPAALSINDSTC